MMNSFVDLYPEITKHMRRVRMKVPPVVVDVRGTYGPAAMALPDEALPRLSEHLGLSEE